jgi:anti-anti-sigma factor
MESDLIIASEEMQAKMPVTVVHLRGWLDRQNEKQFIEATQKAYDNGARFILLDMSEVDTITSAGIRAIQKVFQIFTPKEETYKIAHLKLAGAPPQINHVLGITGFLQNVPMYESVDAALHSWYV